MSPKAHAHEDQGSRRRGSLACMRRLIGTARPGLAQPNRAGAWISASADRRRPDTAAAQTRQLSSHIPDETHRAQPGFPNHLHGIALEGATS